MNNSSYIWKDFTKEDLKAWILANTDIKDWNHCHNIELDEQQLKSLCNAIGCVSISPENIWIYFSDTVSPQQWWIGTEDDSAITLTFPDTCKKVKGESFNNNLKRAKTRGIENNNEEGNILTLKNIRSVSSTSMNLLDAYQFNGWTVKNIRPIPIQIANAPTRVTQSNNKMLPTAGDDIQQSDVPNLSHSDDVNMNLTFLNSLGGMVSLRNFEVTQNNTQKSYRGFSWADTRWGDQRANDGYIYADNKIPDKNSYPYTPLNKRYKWNFDQGDYIPIIIFQNWYWEGNTTLTITNNTISWGDHTFSWDSSQDHLIGYTKWATTSISKFSSWRNVGNPGDDRDFISAYFSYNPGAPIPHYQRWIYGCPSGTRIINVNSSTFLRMVEIPAWRTIETSFEVDALSGYDEIWTQRWKDILVRNEYTNENTFYGDSREKTRPGVFNTDKVQFNFNAGIRIINHIWTDDVRNYYGWLSVSSSGAPSVTDIDNKGASAWATASWIGYAFAGIGMIEPKTERIVESVTSGGALSDGFQVYSEIYAQTVGHKYGTLIVLWQHVNS